MNRIRRTVKRFGKIGNKLVILLKAFFFFKFQILRTEVGCGCETIAFKEQCGTSTAAEAKWALYNAHYATMIRGQN